MIPRRSLVGYRHSLGRSRHFANKNLSHRAGVGRF